MAFLFSLVAAGFAPSARAAEAARLALLIGNQSYSNAVGPLRNPKNDIAVMKAALLKIGFTEANITVVNDAERVAMLEAFEAFATKVGAAGPHAISFFYYSGQARPTSGVQLSHSGRCDRAKRVRFLVSLGRFAGPARPPKFGGPERQAFRDFRCLPQHAQTERGSGESVASAERLSGRARYSWRNADRLFDG